VGNCTKWERNGDDTREARIRRQRRTEEFFFGRLPVLVEMPVDGYDMECV
jgi:hypothetical protein